MIPFLDKRFRENQNTNFRFNEAFSKVVPVMRQRKKKAQTDRRQATDDITIRCMLLACWMTKATDTHSECVNYCCFFTATAVTRRRLAVALYAQACFLKLPKNRKFLERC